MATRTPKSSTLREAFQLLFSIKDAYITKQLCTAVGLVIVNSLCAATAPLVLKLAIDQFEGERPPHALLTSGPLVVIYVLMQYLLRSSTELRAKHQNLGEQRIQRRLSDRLFSHMTRLPLHFHIESQSGALSSTLSYGLMGFQNLLRYSLFNILPVIIELLTVGGVLLGFANRFYLFLFGVAALAYFLVFRSGTKRIAPPARAFSTAVRNANALMVDSLMNPEVVKGLDIGRTLCERYRYRLSVTEVRWAKFMAVRTNNGLLLAAIFAVFLGAVLCFSAVEVTEGTMGLGTFVMLSAYVARLVQPLEMLGTAARDGAQALAYTEQMLRVLRERPEEQLESSVPFKRFSGRVRFENVTFYYGDNPTLVNVSFEIEAGTTVAIVGKTGSGKSTLARLMLRLYDPHGGQIYLDDIPLTSIAPEIVRANFGLVPQDTSLFSGTLMDNVRMGLPGSSDDAVRKAAEFAGLEPFIKRLKHGYRTVVGQRGLKLSGGERQRVAIARAAIRNPAVYILDEATSALDGATAGKIWRNLEGVTTNKTTLIITHRLAEARKADRILVLEQGHLAEQGTHRQLLSTDGIYAELWREQHDAHAILHLVPSTSVPG